MMIKVTIDVNEPIKEYDKDVFYNSGDRVYVNNNYYTCIKSGKSNSELFKDIDVYRDAAKWFIDGEAIWILGAVQ